MQCTVNMSDPDDRQRLYASNGSFGTVIGFMLAKAYEDGPVANSNFVSDDGTVHTGSFLPITQPPKNADLGWIGLAATDFPPHLLPDFMSTSGASEAAEDNSLVPELARPQERVVFDPTVSWPVVQLDQHAHFSVKSSKYLLAHPRAIGIDVPGVSHPQRAVDLDDIEDDVWRVAVSYIEADVSHSSPDGTRAGTAPAVLGHDVLQSSRQRV